MVIVDVPDITDHMSVIMKVMQGGSVEDIQTIALYSGADVVTAAEKASGGDVAYNPVN